MFKLRQKMFNSNIVDICNFVFVISIFFLCLLLNGKC